MSCYGHLLTSRIDTMKNWWWSVISITLLIPSHTPLDLNAKNMYHSRIMMEIGSSNGILFWLNKMNLASDYLWYSQFSSNSEHTFRMINDTPPKPHMIADWFLQEFNPLIQKSGEMRLIVVRGNIILSYIGVCKVYPDTSSFYKGFPTKTLRLMEQRWVSTPLSLPFQVLVHIII